MNANNGNSTIVNSESMFSLLVLNFIVQHLLEDLVTGERKRA